MWILVVIDVAALQLALGFGLIPTEAMSAMEDLYLAMSIYGITYGCPLFLSVLVYLRGKLEIHDSVLLSWAIVYSLIAVFGWSRLGAPGMGGEGAIPLVNQSTVLCHLLPILCFMLCDGEGGHKRF